MRKNTVPPLRSKPSSLKPKRRLQYGFGGVGLWIAASLLGSSATAQEPQNRSLGGYRFVPSNLVADPFITTHWRNATGFGVALDVKLPILVIQQDTLLALSGNVAFVQLEFEYQHAVSDRIALRFTGSGSSRLGTDAQALLTQGVSALTGFRAGTSIRAWNNERFLVSAVAGMSFGSTFRIDLPRFVDDVVNGNLDGASIVLKDDGVILSTGLRAAWAIARWAGLHGQLEGGYRNTVFDDGIGGLAGLAGGVDLGQKVNVPVGLLASLTYDNIALTGDHVGASLMTGIEVIYTGRDDFALGLQVSYTRTPLENPDVTLHGSAYNLTARYYF